MDMNEPRVPLQILDPARGDHSYWDRFHAQVMRSAAPELRRRRARGEVVTVSDVVLSWGRMLVPAALVAATAAGVLIAPRAEEQVMGLEEALQTLVVEPVPEFLLADEPDAALIRVALEGG